MHDLLSKFHRHCLYIYKEVVNYIPPAGLYPMAAGRADKVKTVPGIRCGDPAGCFKPFWAWRVTEHGFGPLMTLNL